jgi:hypothetical protein
MQGVVLCDSGGAARGEGSLAAIALPFPNVTRDTMSEMWVFGRSIAALLACLALRRGGCVFLDSTFMLLVAF